MILCVTSVETFFATFYAVYILVLLVVFFLLRVLFSLSFVSVIFLPSSSLHVYSSLIFVFSVSTTISSYSLFGLLTADTSSITSSFLF